MPPAHFRAGPNPPLADHLAWWARALESPDRLLLMANKLYRFMTILMIPALVLGLVLWLYYGVGQQSLWMHVKLLIVLILVGYHHFCKRLLKAFERGENVRSHVWYRWFNELPVIGMFAAVALVIIKPV